MAAPPKPAAKPPAAKAAVGDLHNYSSCPACNAFVSKKDAICVACGLNLVTGRKLTTTRSSEPTGPPRNIAITSLVLNCVVFPGLGTLIGGRKSERTKGMIQMGLFLVGVIVANPWYPNVSGLLEKYAVGLVATLGGLLVAIIGIVWSAMTGLAILNNAQPG